MKTVLTRNDGGVWGDDPGSSSTIVLRSTEQTIDGLWKIVRPAERTLSPAERAQSLLRPGDLLVTKSSGSASHIGKTTLVDAKVAELECCFSNFMQRLRLSPEVNPHFAWYWLNSAHGREQLTLASTTTTGLGNLTGKLLGQILIPIPPSPEQVAIVRYLSEMDKKFSRLIRNKRRLIALLNEEKQAIIRQAVTRGLDPDVPMKPSGEKWLGEIPEHWKALRGKFIFRETDERTARGTEELLSVSHLTGVTPRSDKNITMFKAESYVGHKIAQPGDLVVNTMWAWMGALGVSNQLGLVSPSYATYRQIVPSTFDDQFLDLMVRIPVYRDIFHSRSTGIRNSRLRLYPDQFLDVRFPVPSLDEQVRILQEVNDRTAELNEAIAHSFRQIDLIREYRTRLIADVVTGQLDVRNVQIEDAAWTVEELDVADVELAAEDDVDSALIEELIDEEDEIVA